MSKFNQQIIKHLFFTQGGADGSILCWAPSRDPVMEASLAILEHQPLRSSHENSNRQNQTEPVRTYMCGWKV